MKIALVMTVKNEERLLKNNLCYHKAIGVDKAFVYFDNTTDQGKESIKDLNYIEINNSVATNKYKHLTYLDKFTKQADVHHTGRQCLNTYDAQLKCKEEGIDWLISVDADELVVIDLEVPSSIKSFFSEIEPNIDVINFKVFEALQQQVLYTNVFAEETYFKTNHKFKSKFGRIYKYFYNPFTKKI